MRKCILLVLLASPALAKGPKYNFDNPLLVDEFVNVYHDISNVSSASTGITATSSITVQGITVSSLTVTSQASIKGTATNDSAAAGFIGEYVSSAAINSGFFPSTGAFGDLAAILLTPGDWDISVAMEIDSNAGTVTSAAGGTWSNPGNDNTGRLTGDNWLHAKPPSSTDLSSIAIPAFRVSLASNTTYYLKYQATYAVATPKATGRISARRVR